MWEIDQLFSMVIRMPLSESETIPRCVKGCVVASHPFPDGYFYIFIVVPVATALSPNLLTVALSATLSGSVFGDHCSPISDTTILSSTGAGCEHMLHVSTQIPYALCAAGCAALGYIAAGLTDGNLPVTLGVSFLSLAVLLWILTRKSANTQKEV